MVGYQFSICINQEKAVDIVHVYDGSSWKVLVCFTDLPIPLSSLRQPFELNKNTLKQLILPEVHLYIIRIRIFP